jgi:hypothetical protein
VCVCVCVCVCVYICVCTYVCVHMCVYICVYICLCVSNNSTRNKQVNAKQTGGHRLPQDSSKDTKHSWAAHASWRQAPDDWLGSPARVLKNQANLFSLLLFWYVASDHCILTTLRLYWPIVNQPLSYLKTVKCILLQMMNFWLRYSSRCKTKTLISTGSCCWQIRRVKQWQPNFYIWTQSWIKNQIAAKNYLMIKRWLCDCVILCLHVACALYHCRWCGHAKSTTQNTKKAFACVILLAQSNCCAWVLAITNRQIMGWSRTKSWQYLRARCSLHWLSKVVAQPQQHRLVYAILAD